MRICLVMGITKLHEGMVWVSSPFISSLEILNNKLSNAGRSYIIDLNLGFDCAAHCFNPKQQFRNEKENNGTN